MTPTQAGVVMIFMTLVLPFFVTITGSERNGGMSINASSLSQYYGELDQWKVQISSFMYSCYTTSYQLFTFYSKYHFFRANSSLFDRKTLLQEGSDIRDIGFFLFPFIITFNLMIAILLHGYLAYAGPLPFQIIIGLILMKYLEPPTEILWESEKARRD